MTNNDILILAKAGFTAEQIAALNAIKEEPAPAPAAPEPPAPNTDEILAAISGLGKQLQTSNLQAAQQPAQPATVDNILANIINPPEIFKKEE